MTECPRGECFFDYTSTEVYFHSALMITLNFGLSNIGEIEKQINTYISVFSTQIDRVQLPLFLIPHRIIGPAEKVWSVPATRRQREAIY